MTNLVGRYCSNSCRPLSICLPLAHIVPRTIYQYRHRCDLNSCNHENRTAPVEKHEHTNSSQVQKLVNLACNRYVISNFGHVLACIVYPCPTWQNRPVYLNGLVLAARVCLHLKQWEANKTMRVLFLLFILSAMAEMNHWLNIIHSYGEPKERGDSKLWMETEQRMRVEQERHAIHVSRKSLQNIYRSFRLAGIQTYSDSATK